MNIEIRSIKTVNLLDVVHAAGEDGWSGNPIWDELLRADAGGLFRNDVIYRYTLPSINGEELTHVQERIKQICWAGLEDEDTIYFEVSW